MQNSLVYIYRYFREPTFSIHMISEEGNICSNIAKFFLYYHMSSYLRGQSSSWFYIEQTRKYAINRLQTKENEGEVVEQMSNSRH
jgi:hypothetical protein